MNKTKLLALSLIAALVCSCAPKIPSASLAEMVNPMIGTDFTGNTYPGAQVPFGMVQLSPDNGTPGWDRIAGYFYPDTTIAGFSHTHLSGTGAGDLYDISFMPTTSPVKCAEEPLGIYSSFSHDSESAHAGYYKVHLDDYGIDVELTATPRGGVQRYTFPEADGSVYLNLRKAMNWDATLDTELEVVDDQTIQGYRFSTGWAPDQKIYFYAKFSRPFDSHEIDSMDIEKDGAVIGTSHIGRFDFKTAEGEQILVSTALSATSIEGAKRNFEAELADGDFDQHRLEAENAWDKKLRKFTVKDPNFDNKVVFYTALYHSMLAPTIYNDVDGSYRGADDNIHHGDFVNYGTFSLWDTYRAAHPLYTLMAPTEAVDMVKSLIAFYEQNGRLPVWNFQGCETDMMIGHHSIPVIVDCYLKGLGDFDAEHALEACLATANNDEYRGVGHYKKFGYMPSNLEGESLSKTLEYGYNDYCIARMAEKMGKTDLAKEYYARSEGYRHHYNPESSFLEPRDDKGNFLGGFDAKDYTEHITESNGWQYFWYAPHDVDGLIELVGGSERFGEKLDSMFTYHPTEDDELPIFSTGMIGQYAHGNEPSHHVIYLYNSIGQRSKAQKYAHQVMSELYTNTPAGLCGNEDCGQMSAWYIFSAMGFYPVDPVGGVYELGTPMFAEMTLDLEDGKQFKITTSNHSAENFYVKSVSLNGEPWTKSYITHDQIVEGATLHFEMTDRPE